MSAVKKSRSVVLGEIGPAFGVQGWVHVHSFTDPVDNLLEHLEWNLVQKNQVKTHKLQLGRVHGRGLAVKLSDCDDRDQAALLRGAKIVVQREDLPELDEGEFYWSDLEGLTVEYEGKPIGTVDYLYQAGSEEVMVVKGLDNKTQHIPFRYGDVVTKVDLAAQVITIDWIVIE